MNPRVFELSVSATGIVGPGRGVLAAFVPASVGEHAMVFISGDPRYDPGRPVEQLASVAVGWLQRELGDAVAAAQWAMADNSGRYYRLVPPATIQRFAAGLGSEALYKEVGPAAEAAVELLTTAIARPSQDAATPDKLAFLHAVEAHGSLPAPGVLFQKVALAAEDGDARQMANVIQPDPVIAAALINYANAARFAGKGKTASVPEAVTRLGTAFVKRVVFIAEMMTRYQKGACPAFDYRGFWLNAIATAAAMRALLAEQGMTGARADEAFTTGLLSGIGWLVVAETHPALMQRYLERCRAADPIGKTRAQHEIFPCEIFRVSERYLQRFAFPESVSAAVAGRPEVDRQWYDLLARAVRVGQALSPFACLAIPTTIPVPEACRAEWQQWRGFLAAPR